MSSYQSTIKVQAAKNGSAQLSQGKFFLMASKFKIRKGSKAGSAIYNVKLSELGTDPNDKTKTIFTEIKTFLMSQEEFDAWLALLMQVSNAKLPEE